MRLNRNPAFTLVELLVVITIIGIIMALALPTLNAARESARILQCKNNLRQLGMAAQVHNSEQTVLPSGGWGWHYAGAPSRGFRELQPGGWTYNVLPFMDNLALHNSPGKARFTSPVPQFHCPSKRKPILYPLRQDVSGWLLMRLCDENMQSPYTYKLQTIARADYAGNGGTRADPVMAGTATAFSGSLDKYIKAPNSEAVVGLRAFWKTQVHGLNNCNGAVCLGTGQSIQAISEQDGSTNTVMYGERHINPDDYFNGSASDDDQGWDQGYDRDTIRWGGADEKIFGMARNDLNYTPAIISKIQEYYTRKNLSKNHWIPIQDKAGYTSPARWGSPHGDSINFVMVDSSVKSVNYGVDPFVFYCLCNYKDGQGIPPGVLK